MNNLKKTEASMDKKPLVTFALFAFNQEQYIREALAGALSQTYSPLQIILSDDCSSDRTFEIMREVASQYHGPHKVLLNRNENNLGVNKHVNLVCSGLATGDLIVMQAGDDISKSNRVSETVRVWLLYKPAAIYCDAEVINHEGLITGTWRVCNEKYNGYFKYDLDSGDYLRPSFCGATAAYDAGVFKDFENLPGDILGEDIILMWRAAVTGGVFYLSQPLLQYRHHNNNLSQWSKRANKSFLMRLNALTFSEEYSLKNNEYLFKNLFIRLFPEKKFTQIFFETVLMNRVQLLMLGRFPDVSYTRMMADLFRKFSVRLLLRLCVAVFSTLKVLGGMLTFNFRRRFKLNR